MDDMYPLHKESLFIRAQIVGRQAFPPEAQSKFPSTNYVLTNGCWMLTMPSESHTRYLKAVAANAQSL